MYKVKEFTDCKSNVILTTAVNDWLINNHDIVIKDIRYSVCSDYSGCLILYEEL